MKIKYSGKKSAEEIDNIVNIPKNEEITQIIKKFYIHRNVCIIISLLILAFTGIDLFISAVINDIIFAFLMLVCMVLILHQKKFKKRSDNKIKEIINNNFYSMLYIQVYYENMKRSRLKSKIEIYIFYIIIILLGLNKSEEALEIVEKFNVDKNAFKELFTNTIFSEDMLKAGELDKADEKLMQICTFKIKNKKLNNILFELIAKSLDARKITQEKHFINLVKNNKCYKRNKKETKILKAVTIFVIIFCIFFICILAQFGMMLCKFTKKFSDFNIRKNMIEMQQDVKEKS